MAEAHLRYGRVLEKRGDYRAAERSLGEALQRDESTFVSYVARVVLGGIAERRGDLETAIASYTTATEIIPSWETAYIALSHALHVAGRYEESARVLASTLQAEFATSEDFDGWMVYELGRTKRLAALWAKMQEEVSF